MHCTTLIVAIFAYKLDYVEPESEFQAELAQEVFGGLQASSCEYANIVVIKASPGASNTILEFCLLLYISCYDSWMCIRL
jgi:hypothetical protein